MLQAVKRSLTDLQYCRRSLCCGTDSSYRYLIIKLMFIASNILKVLFKCCLYVVASPTNNRVLMSWKSPTAVIIAMPMGAK